jgi:hypothetical protein
MPPDKYLSKQGCDYQFRNHEIFNPHKSRSVNICPSFFVHGQLHQSASLFVASFLLFIYLLLFVILPVVSYSLSFALLDHFKFVSVSFCSVSSDCMLFDYSVLFSVLILVYSRYFDPHNNNHLASQ